MEFTVGDRVIIHIPRDTWVDPSISIDALCGEFNGRKGTVTRLMEHSRRAWHVVLDDYPGSGDDPVFRAAWLEPITVLDQLAET